MNIIDEPGRSRVERKKEETKKKIIAAAMRLIKEQGLEATTMEQIARDADIAKGTLYNYFPVKEAIIDEYIKRKFREKSPDRFLRLQKLPDTRSRMVVTFTELMEGVGADKALFEKYLVYRMQNMVSFKQEDTAKSGFYLSGLQIIRLGQKNGEIRTDLPSYVLEDLLEFAFIAVVKQFYLEPEDFSTNRAVEQCVDFFMNAVKPDSSKSK